MSLLEKEFKRLDDEMQKAVQGWKDHMRKDHGSTLTDEQLTKQFERLVNAK